MSIILIILIFIIFLNLFLFKNNKNESLILSLGNITFLVLILIFSLIEVPSYYIVGESSFTETQKYILFSGVGIQFILNIFFESNAHLRRINILTSLCLINFLLIFISNMFSVYFLGLELLWIVASIYSLREVGKKDVKKLLLISSLSIGLIGILFSVMSANMHDFKDLILMPLKNLSGEIKDSIVSKDILVYLVMSILLIKIPLIPFSLKINETKSMKKLGPSFILQTFSVLLVLYGLVELMSPLVTDTKQLEYVGIFLIFNILIMSLFNCFVESWRNTRTYLYVFYSLLLYVSFASGFKEQLVNYCIVACSLYSIIYLLAKININETINTYLKVLLGYIPFTVGFYPFLKALDYSYKYSLISGLVITLALVSSYLVMKNDYNNERDYLEVRTINPILAKAVSVLFVFLFVLLGLIPNLI